jgi:hypothetical protein
MMNIGEEFHPDRKMMVLFLTYAFAVVIPLFVLGVGILLVISFFYYQYFAAEIFALVYFIPLIIISAFIVNWIPKYFKSVKYHFTETEVRVEEGVYWKERHAIPYSRIMNVDTIQGPLARRFGIGTVDIYTAGYTGAAGGTGGPRARRAEASIKYVTDFMELREQVLGIVRGKPIFSSGAAGSEDVQMQILDELREVRKLMEKRA